MSWLIFGYAAMGILTAFSMRNDIEMESGFAAVVGVLFALAFWPIVLGIAFVFALWKGDLSL